MFVNKSDSATLKVCDFGTSRMMNENKMQKLLGTVI